METPKHKEVLEAYENKWTLLIYYGMSALVLIAIAVFVFRGNWKTALSTSLVLLCMFIPSILKERYRYYIPFAIRLGVTTFIFFTLFLGEVGNFYNYIPLWDKFVHFESGLVLGAIGFLLVYMFNEHKNIKLGLSPGFLSVFAVTFSISFGVIWEIIEFIGDHIFHSRWQWDNADTMWDLIADLTGAIVISTVAYFWMHRNKRLPFTPWMLSIFHKKEKE